MKKTLLTMALGLLLGSQVYAQEPAIDMVYAPETAAYSAPKLGPTADGFEMRFCGSIRGWLALTKSSNVTYNCYIYINEDIATELAGNQVTSISLCASVSSLAAGLNGSVYVSEDLEGDPATSTTAKIKNGRVGNGRIQEIALEEPYTIKEGQGFYIGYTAEKVKYNSDYPISVDGLQPSAFAGGCKITASNGADKGTFDIGEETGSNIILFAKTVGDKHDVNNIINVGNVAVGGNFTSPIINVSEGLTINIPMYNFGSNDITTLGYTAIINDGEPTSAEIEVNVPAGTNAMVPVTLQNIPSSRNTVDFQLNSVNGVPMELGITTTFVGVNNGYTRKFVVEEGTGTWCGWCPRGIVGLETMSELYPDRFIGIAVHSGDTFAVSSYSQLINKFFDGFPSCVVNRDPLYKLDPSYSDLQTAYDAWLSQSAIAEIEMTVEKLSNTKLNVQTSTTFALSEDNAEYKIAFVCIEDGLTGTQTNYYAGGSYGQMGGWESKGSSVNWTYYDTARGIYSCWGLSNSVPETIVEGESYVFDHNLTLTGIKNINNTAIIALLLDPNGVIANATKVKAADYTTGISTVTVDENAPVEYYNMQGIRMDGNDMPAGVYLKKQGDAVTKTIIR